MPPKPAYVNGGTLTETKRSKWRLSYIPEFVWGFLNEIAIFVGSLIGNDYGRNSNRINSSGRGGRRIGGFDASGNVSGGGGSGSGGSNNKDRGAATNRRGDMKNILACNAASGS